MTAAEVAPEALAEGRRLLAAATHAPWVPYGPPFPEAFTAHQRANAYLSVAVGHIGYPLAADEAAGPQAGSVEADGYLVCWMRNHIDALLAALAAAREEGARLRAVLEFYGDPATYQFGYRWIETAFGQKLYGGLLGPGITEDAGAKARAALAPADGGAGNAPQSRQDAQEGRPGASDVEQEG